MVLIYSPDGSNIYGGRDGELEGKWLVGGTSYWLVQLVQLFWHCWRKRYRLATMRSVTDGRTDGIWTDRQTDRQTKRSCKIMPTKHWNATTDWLVPPNNAKKNPAFRALHLAGRNEFHFWRLLNTCRPTSFSFFCCWLLPEKFSVCLTNNGFARLSPLPSPVQSPGSYAYDY